MQQDVTKTMAGSDGSAEPATETGSDRSVEPIISLMVDFWLISVVSSLFTIGVVGLVIG